MIGCGAYFAKWLVHTDQRGDKGLVLLSTCSQVLGLDPLVCGTSVNESLVGP